MIDANEKRMFDFEMKRLNRILKDSQLDLFLAALRIVSDVQNARAFHPREFTAAFPKGIDEHIDRYDSTKAKNEAAFQEWFAMSKKDPAGSDLPF